MRRIEDCPISELRGKPRERLQALWRAAFGDTAAYVRRFFGEAYDGTRAVFVSEDAAYPSALYLLPALVRTAGGFAEANLVYAVATDARHKGRGLATELLNYANSLNATFLKPADEGLFGFYAARGYETGFYVSERVVSREISRKPPPCDRLPPASPETFAEARERFLGGEGFVRWSVDAVRFAISDEAVYGGRAVCLCGGAALYSVEAGAVIVKELAIPPEAVDDAAVSLMRQEGVSACRLRLKAEKGAGTPFGMVRGLNVRNGYFGLSMD